MIEVSPVLAKVQFDRLCVMKSEKLPLGCYFSFYYLRKTYWYDYLLDKHLKMNLLYNKTLAKLHSEIITSKYKPTFVIHKIF